MKKLIAWGVKLAPLDPPLIEGKGAEEAGVAATNGEGAER